MLEMGTWCVCVCVCVCVSTRYHVILETGFVFFNFVM